MHGNVLRSVPFISENAISIALIPREAQKQSIKQLMSHKGNCIMEPFFGTLKNGLRIDLQVI